MREDDKIYGLIAQAEDIQKHTVELQENTSKVLKSILVKADGELQKIIIAAGKEIKKKSTWAKIYPLVFGFSFILMAFIITLFYLHGLKVERRELIDEINSINMTLSKTAEVVEVTDQPGHWVVIDPKQEILHLQNGQTVARLPKR